MSDNYTPPKVWDAKSAVGGKFSNINRPTAGAREERNLPVGDHPFQLYSLATPNGVKVSIMFEELLEKGIKEAEYDAYTINIGEGDQFTSGFVEVNPNSKIPAMIDQNNGSPIRVFESGSILLYLAEKFEQFLPKNAAKRTEVINWLFWQVGSGPYLGGGFGHFFSYAPEKLEYPINRFAMETKRQLDLLDKQLKDHKFITGDEYTIADMAIFPWYGALALGKLYDNSAEFLAVHEYKNLQRWANMIKDRPAVKRGRVVNNNWGDEDQQLKERHSEDDFKNINLDNVY
ncbi:MAG: glutathione-dependent disulfide-bond oxidoreductase [Halobacteriovoraceae bacterium]|nr:glutathione-dependent disulfide-bond oxidoreductase [Halobacteriovoraceae bacterium]|tara:strand:+ start:322 stop:1185 length:864 start_codon:yes stop_codon:yes gene_type:complete